MQRVRIGLTGLACVFVLVLLAAALLGLARRQAELSGTPIANSASVPTDNSAANAADAPKDPLAELGVAPGNVPEAPQSPSPGAPVTSPQR